MANDFAPWRRDYIATCWILIAGMSVGWALLFVGWPYLAGLVCGGFTYSGLRRFLFGRAREYGIEVERNAIEDLRRELFPLGYDIECPDFMIEGVGNVDALVRLPNDSLTFVIEIKSYSGIVSRWWGGLSRHGKLPALFKEPRQVRRQCRSLGSERHLPILWCPISKLNNLVVYGDILVVNGGIQVLKIGLNRYYEEVRLPVWIKFSSFPPDDIRHDLKKKGFKWRRVSRIWLGRATVAQLLALNSRISSVAGETGLQWR